MTDFILGIFTGISIAILWGMYLNKQREKETRERAQQVVDSWLRPDPDPSRQSWIAKVVRDPRTASEQLQAAIERDDFEEAARLRDLMNKK